MQQIRELEAVLYKVLRFSLLPSHAFTPLHKQQTGGSIASQGAFCAPEIKSAFDSINKSNSSTYCGADFSLVKFKVSLSLLPSPRLYRKFFFMIPIIIRTRDLFKDLPCRYPPGYQLSLCILPRPHQREQAYKSSATPPKRKSSVALPLRGRSLSDNLEHDPAKLHRHK